MEKMVSTYLLKNTTQPDASYGILCGPVSGYLANAKNWTYSVDPQTVWNYYLRGSAERGGILGGLVDVTDSVFKSPRTEKLQVHSKLYNFASLSRQNLLGLTKNKFLVHIKDGLSTE
jgi:hypothetical protein